MKDSNITINTIIKWKIFQMSSVEALNHHPCIIYVKNVFHILTETFQQRTKGFFMQGFEKMFKKSSIIFSIVYNIETMLLIAITRKETLHEQKDIFQMVHLTKRLFVIQLLLLSLLAHFIAHRNSFSFLDSH